jgi:NAD(P)-dependent dehydrogenase (short-subunit alcohol dehydrogenase family)
MQLNEVRAVVSGGASGLGLAAATRIVQAGGMVSILDISEAQGKAALASLGARAFFAQTDVSDEAAVDAAVAEAKVSMGGINAAVMCAGVANPARLLGKQGPMAASFLRKVIEINLIGTVLVAKAAAFAMSSNKPNDGGERGVIVMTASVAAFDGQIGQVAYSASKGGIVGLTLPMARELASSGIRVMTVAPGLFLTPMMKSLPQEVQESLGRQTPFPPRLGEPQEYAALVTHIIENMMLNGETIRLDGAVRMQPR